MPYPADFTFFMGFRELISATFVEKLIQKLGISVAGPFGMFRGQRIARFLMEKEELDNHLLAADHSQWYYIDRTKVVPYMLEKFHQFYIDEEMDMFLRNSVATSNSFCLQIYYALFSSLLSLVMTKTSINGLLNRGSMHLFSLNQLREFLDIPVEWISRDKRLLDLGAGDGQITATLAQLYADVSVTEASRVMEWRLRQRGFTVVSKDFWHLSGSYHLVSALNLLDRHYSPSLLLAQLHSLTLRSNSLLLLALVLPLQQYVEFHPSKKTNKPDTKIPIRGKTFEEQACSIVTDVLEPAGFHLLRWGKLPYLCEGDLKMAFYYLDDAVFLLKPVSVGLDENDPPNALNASSSNRDFISL